MDFLNRGQEHRELDIEKILSDATDSFISNHKKKIIRQDERGNRYCIFSSDMFLKFINTLGRSIDYSVSSYIQHNYLSETKEVSNSEIMNTLSGIVGSVERIENDIIKGTTYSLEGRPEQYYILPKLCTDQETISKSLTAILGRIDSLVNSQQDIIKHNSMVIEEQHNRILRYENDVLFKSKKELLMELIGIADQIKFTLDEQQANKDYESLLEAIKALGEWVNGSLQTETVRKFEISKNITSQLNAKYQEVTGSEPTENPNENGHYKTMLPGYFWTMPLVGSAALQTNNPEPKSFEFVLRPEYVVRLVFSGRTQTARQTSSQDETTPIRESKEIETGEHKKTDFQRTISIDDKDDINHVNSKGNCKQEDSGRYPIDFGSEEDQIQNDRGINNNE